MYHSYFFVNETRKEIINADPHDLTIQLLRNFCKFNWAMRDQIDLLDAQTHDIETLLTQKGYLLL